MRSVASRRMPKALAGPAIRRAGLALQKATTTMQTSFSAAGFATEAAPAAASAAAPAKAVHVNVTKSGVAVLKIDLPNEKVSRGA